MASVPASSGTGARLLDQQMLALLAARTEEQPSSIELSIPADADERLLDLQALAQAQLQALTRARDLELSPRQSRVPAGTPPGLPGLAARMLPVTRERLQAWPGKRRRERRLVRLEQAALEGDLVAMLDLACRDDAWSTDNAALTAARNQADALRTAQRVSLAAGPQRAQAARVAGREIAMATGIVAVLGAVAAGIIF